MGELIFLIIIIFVAVALCAFFSMAETSITCASNAQIHKLKSEGNKKAEILSNLRKDKDKFISVALLCNTASTVAASVYASKLALLAFGDEGSLIVATFMTLILFLMGEVLPKTIALEKADNISLALAPFISILVRIFHPITHNVQLIIKLIKNIFYISKQDKISAEEELRGTIAYHHDEGDMQKHDRDMLDSILSLAETDVSDIMTHRKNMVTFNINDPVEDNINTILKTPYTRLPFWKDNPDNIIGILHIKDLLSQIILKNQSLKDIDIKSLLSEPWFIPDSTVLKEQLEEFRKKRCHFAIVIDEYNSIMGMITLEDLLEEIVGKIEDEYDIKSTEIIKQDDGYFILKGQLNIRTINRELDWSLPTDHASTIGGLIIHEIQKIPEEGEVFNFYSFEFKILKKNNNQILLIQARLSDNDSSKKPEETI